MSDIYNNVLNKKSAHVMVRIYFRFSREISLWHDSLIGLQPEAVAIHFLKRDMALSGQCRLTVSKPLPGSTAYSWGLTKGSIYKEDFDRT